MTARSFDVVIAGGGLAGSSLGGVLARSGLGVLVVEKEGGFRDRIRGELSWPWGHSEALRAGLRQPLEQGGVVPMPGIGFSHPRLQEVLLGWAESQGATVLRPAKVVGVGDGQGATVSIVSGGAPTEYQ